MKKMYKTFIKICLVSMFVFSSFCTMSTAVAKGKIRIRAQYYFGTTNEDGKIFEAVKYKAIEKDLGDEIKLKGFTHGSLAGWGEELGAITEGTIDMAMLPLFTFGDMPDGLDVVPGSPLIFDSILDAYNVYYKHGLLELYREAMAETFDVYFVGPVALGASGFLTNFAVHKAADFKGKKVDSMGMEAKILKAMGGVPTTIPFEDWYLALKLGTTEGGFTTYSDLVGENFKEVVNYVVEPGLTCCIQQGWLVSMKKWKALSPKAQQYLNNLVQREFIPAHLQSMAYLDTVIAETADLNRTTLPAADVEALKPIVQDEFKKLVRDAGPYGKRAYDIIAKYNNWE